MCIASMFKLDIIDRYVFRFFLKTFLGTLFLLNGVAIIVKIIDSMKEFSKYNAPTSLLIEYFIVSLPTFATYIVPPAMMFSVAFTIAQFSRNFELTVIMAAGRSFRRILRPIIIFSLLLSIAFFIFSEYVAYPSSYHATDISYDIRGRGREARLRKFDHSSNMTLRFGDRYYTIGNGEWVEKRLSGFHLLELSENGVPQQIIQADLASTNSPETNSWVLSNARVSRFDNSGKYLGTEIYEKIPVELHETLKSFQNFYVEMDSEERSVFDAYKIYQKRKTSSGEYRGFLTEVYWHIGYPMVCFFIAWIGGIVGGRLKKGNAATSIGISMIFTIAYFFVMYFGTAFGETGAMPAIIAGNLANIVSAGAAIWLYIKVDY